MMVLGRLARAFSTYIDGVLKSPLRSTRELAWERIGKLPEEVGEVFEAFIGAGGTNPRKGFTHTIDDVKRELLDVAYCALGAHEHLDGNRGNSVMALQLHARERNERAGIE